MIGINFHGIGTPHGRVPADEVPYWLDEPAFAGLVARIAALRSAGQDIRITFDDGNLSDLAIAAPILNAHGLKGEFFVLTGRLDDPDYLSPQGIQALLAMGHAIGLHGRDHVDWRKVDGATLIAETRDARQRLAAITGTAINSVAIPFGAYDRRVIRHLRQEGFAAIHTSDGGVANARARVRPRTSLRQDMDAATLDAILAGRSPPMKTLRRRLSMLLRQHVK